MRKDAINNIFKKYNVKIAYLFGSQQDAGLAFLNGLSKDIKEYSDLDIGVVFEKIPSKIFEAYGDLYAKLSLLFEPFKTDLVFLQETPILLQYEAICGKLIYCEDEGFLEEYEEMIMKMASDLMFKKKEFEKDFLEAIKDGYFEITHR